MRNTPFRAKNKKRAFDFQLVMKFVITLVITKSIQYLGYLLDGFLLILVEHLCVYLSSGEVSVSEKFRHGVDVGAKVEHHHGECMPSAMECYLLVYPCSQYPPLYGFVGTRWGIDVPEYAFTRFAPLAHEFRSLRCDVKVFKSARLFLFEDDPGIFALLVNLSPCQLQYVAPAKSGQTREQERLFYVWIFAFGLRQLLQFVNGKVHSRSLLGLEALYATYRVVGDNPFIESLIETRTQLVEVAEL